tara:strand:+ start:3093 stop:3281 length:189 start_codon:yes stop_codon:yes gene_type:complete
MPKFIVKGNYAYKVEKQIEATSKDEAFEIATNHSEALCEWNSQDQDTYFEEVVSVEEDKDDD